MCVWLGLQIVVDVLSVGLGQRLVNQFLHDATAHAAGQPLRQSAVDEGYLQSLYAEVQYVGAQWDAVYFELPAASVWSKFFLTFSTMMMFLKNSALRLPLRCTASLIILRCV